MENHLVEKLIGLAHHQHKETYMGKQEVGEAALRRDRRKLGLVGWVHLQLKVRLTDSLFRHDSQPGGEGRRRG